MGDHQAEAAEANGEEAQREEDAGHLLPEYAQAYLRTEGAAGAGGRGRDLDEGPQGERPDEQADRLRQGIPVLRRGGDQGGDRVGVERTQRGDERGPQNPTEQRTLDRTVRPAPGPDGG